MIKVRLSNMGGNPTEIEIVSGETVKQAATRALEPLNLDRDISEIFQILVNGKQLDPFVWDVHVINEQDEMLIAPKLGNAEQGASALRTFLFVALTVVAAPLIAGLGGGAVATALLTAGASVAIGVLVNSLIPVPVPATDAIDSTKSDLSSSQMFSGQSNQARKLSTVPKVYGTHRMFPNVAANPYIELVADSSTEAGVVQYLYAIYDFGFGPSVVSNLKIGDTPIEKFTDVTMRYVDFNRPLVDGGDWDKPLNNSLALYKGDYYPESVTVALNANKDDSGPVAGYQVIRNSADNLEGDKQEITLNFICPNGLYGYQSNGSSIDRSILLEIYFKKVGDSTEYSFSDYGAVESFDFVGGDVDYSNKDHSFLAFNETNYDVIATTQTLAWNNVFIRSTTTVSYQYKEFGWAKGRTSIVLDGTSTDNTRAIIVGDHLFLGSERLGKVSSIAFHSYVGDRTFISFTLDEPLAKAYGFGVQRVTKTVPRNTLTPSYVYANPDLSSRRVSARRPNYTRCKITSNSSSTIYAMAKFVPKQTGQFEVRVTRIDSFSPSEVGIFNDDLTVSTIATRFDRSPIVTTKRHTFLEIKIKATDQLNGTIQTLSGEVTSVLDTWNGSAWVKAPTSNPAWVFCDLLTSEVNKKAIDKDRLDLTSIVEWSEYCDAVPDNHVSAPPFVNKRFSSNFILDYGPTLATVINQVTSASSASLNMVGGKYGVLLDIDRTVPVQIFTPRNSSNFQASRNYTTPPHGLKIKYVDPASDWQVVEKSVYADGYNSTTATEMEEIQSFACTNPEQAWRYGRYLLAVASLRQETITIDVDFEHLVCTRGDYVQITQDVMKAGGYPARVKSVVGSTITIDDGIETGAFSYAYVFRAIAGTIYQNSITSIVDSDTFVFAGATMPAVGDLVVIGVASQVVFDCFVKSISPGDDLTATLTLVERASGIFLAESGAPISDYDPQLSIVANTEYLPPSEVEALAILENTYEIIGRAYQYYILVDWDVPSGAAFENFEVFVNSGQGYSLYGVTTESQLKIIVSRDRLGVAHTIKVLAVSATGKKLELGTVGSVTATPLPKTTPPSDIASFNIDITGETLQFLWELIPDLDCEEYLIRYSPNIAANWEASIPLLRASSNQTLAATQARTGVYFIKAVDFNGNQSNAAVSARTTIPNLFGLNVVDVISDFPSLPGDFDRVEKNGDTLILSKQVVGGVESTEYYSEGYYYYSTLLNLGDIYTVRLQSSIEAEGFTLSDLMSNWTSLADLALMSNSSFSEWDVETQYRTTDILNTIDTWDPMSDVTQMSSGDADNWSPWRKFTISDATGKFMQFRLKLISNKTSVSPRVFIGEINADMPDRVESFNNIVATAIGGATVTYSPGFYGPGTSPNVQVSISNAGPGDYWDFDYKTLDGALIRFYDKDNVAVTRNFDLAAKGYGRKYTSIL